MKVHPKPNAGNVLFATLITTGIISMFMGGYLSLVRSENQFTSRSQTWNTAIPIAEAGIEEAMTQLRVTFPSPSTANDWKEIHDASGLRTYYWKSNSFNPDEYYLVGIFPAGGVNDKTPVIVSQGFARVSGKTNFISRTVRVNTKVSGPPMAGMVVVTNATLVGDKIAIDSFNSTNILGSTADGKYDITKRGDKATLASLSSVSNSINIVNADVWGKVATPYGASAKFGAQSSIGNLAWHNAGKTGVQQDPNPIIDDLNYSIERPVAPYTNATMLTGSGSFTLGDGTYKVDNLSGNLIVNGKAKLLVTSSCDISDIRIQNPSGTASLELYVAAKDAIISGTPNVEGKASNFKYIGLPPNPGQNWVGNQTLTCGGNGEFTAMMNAPGTRLILRGGGQGVQDFSGACIVGSLVMNGSYNFHFDEAIADDMANKYIAISWDELAVSWEKILANGYTTKSPALLATY
jgi:hypothetical protein